MWTVQLSGVIGALPLLAAAAALSRRLRVAAALAVAALLEVSPESAATTFAQRGHPAETGKASDPSNVTVTWLGAEAQIGQQLDLHHSAWNRSIPPPPGVLARWLESGSA